MSDLAKDIVAQWEKGDGDRTTFKTSWQDIANYMHPNRNDYIIERTPGMKRMQFVFDATPLWALEQFAAGLHSMLTSPSLQWFYLWTESDALNQLDHVRAWLEAAAQVMYGIFNGPRHNFAAQSHELYLDLGSIGTAVMAVLESQRSGILFSTRHVKECVIFENEEDRVDTLIRKWSFTAKQAKQAWHDKAGEKVLKAAADEKTSSTKFPFLHAVRPRRQRDTTRRDKRNKAWESVYVSLEDMSEIDVSGFDEFPYLVPRFAKIAGEVYGRGPGWTALPDVKMLNELTKLTLKALEKVVDPPLQLPDSTFIVPIKTSPASLNYYRANSNGRIEPIETKGQPQLGIDALSRLEQKIIRTFYVDLLLMPSDPDKPAGDGKGITATYVLHKRDQTMQLLSPMLARLQSEFLGPLIDRVFAILWRRSMMAGWNQDPRRGAVSPFPAPPPELSGAPLRVQYVSPIALAQKASQTDAIEAVLQAAQALLPIDPKIGRVIDGEGILRTIARDRNAPVVTLKSPERVAQEAQAEAEAQQAMLAHGQLESVASAAKDGSAAVKNLSVIQGGAQGAPQQEREAA